MASRWQLLVECCQYLWRSLLLGLIFWELGLFCKCKSLHCMHYNVCLPGLVVHTFSLLGHLFFPAGQGNEYTDKNICAFVSKPNVTRRSSGPGIRHFLLMNERKTTTRYTGFPLLRFRFFGTLSWMRLVAVRHFLQGHVVELVAPKYSAQLFIYHFWRGGV